MSDLEVAESSPTPLPVAAAALAGPYPRRSGMLAELTRNLPEQHGFVPLRVDGRLPADLRGTIVRNGPGVFERFGARVPHTFEGDGAITAVRFDGDRALGACRVTESAGLREELAQNRVLYGTGAPWRRRVVNAWRGRDKNTANTSVMTWQGRLLALMEGGRPTELALDDADIRTIGETDLGVVGPTFSAHPHRVPSRHATYNFGVRYGRTPAIDLYELPDVGPARKLGSLPLDFNPMLHDFIATEHHLVFFLSPVALSVPRMMLQIGDFNDMWKWRPERGTEVIAVPIAAPDRAVRFPVDAFYQWHFANAWSRSPTEIVVDYVHYRNFDSFDALSSASNSPKPDDLDGRLYRAVVDLATPRLTSEPRWDRACEFPRVHPSREGVPHQLTWLAADDLRTIVRVDGSGRADVADFGDSALVSEPIVVPRSSGSEADAWILALVHDRDLDRSHLAILDGLRLADGPVARCWFDHFVPVTFHGTWIDA